MANDGSIEPRNAKDSEIVRGRLLVEKITEPDKLQGSPFAWNYSPGSGLGSLDYTDDHGSNNAINPHRCALRKYALCELWVHAPRSRKFLPARYPLFLKYRTTRGRPSFRSNATTSYRRVGVPRLLPSLLLLRLHRPRSLKLVKTFDISTDFGLHFTLLSVHFHLRRAVHPNHPVERKPTPRTPDRSTDTCPAISRATRLSSGISRFCK